MPALKPLAREIDAADQAYQEAIPRYVKDVEEWLPRAQKALADGQTVPRIPDWPRHPLDSNEKPTAFYNGMIFPLVPFAIRGVIWY